jgi:hypothetical protein
MQDGHCEDATTGGWDQSYFTQGRGKGREEFLGELGLSDRLLDRYGS